MIQDHQLREHPASTIQRLKALGVWPDADRLLRKVKQQCRRRFAKAGGTAAQVQLEMAKAAWDAVHDRWPPTPGTRPLESLASYLRTTRGRPTPSKYPMPLLSLEAEQRFDEIGETDNLDADIVWVYHHLGDASIDPLHAPSRGAWSLLMHARQDERQFYEKLYLPVAKQQARGRGQSRSDRNIYGVTEDERLSIESIKADFKKAIAASKRMLEAEMMQED